MRLRRRFALFALALLGSLVVAWASVPATIVPPTAPVEPVTVHVAEHGIHARLIMPQGDQWVQYGFGDWEYYALSRQGVGEALAALLLPTPGALGWGIVTSLEGFRERPDQEGSRLLSFEVAAAQASDLMQALNARFTEQIPQGHVFNPRNQLNLVQDDRTYTLLHNSNHELAEWLESLHCQVRGLVLWTGFRLEAD